MCFTETSSQNGNGGVSKHSRTKKTNNKRFVRYSGRSRDVFNEVSKFMQLAKDAKACYKVESAGVINLILLMNIRDFPHCR